MPRGSLRSPSPAVGTSTSRGRDQFCFETYEYEARPDTGYTRPEDIEDALLRTPLQRAIQLMKRHRDVRFDGLPEEDDKPIAIIISTLAAKLYRGQADMLLTTADALRYIVNALAEHASLASEYVTERVLQENIRALRLIERDGDKWYISNPVNPASPWRPRGQGGELRRPLARGTTTPKPRPSSAGCGGCRRTWTRSSTATASTIPRAL